MRYFIICLLFLSGCAGPLHQYYNPAVVDGPKFKGPVTMKLVQSVPAEKEAWTKEGYVLIGTADYVGKSPKAAELSSQAKRIHANHVVYSSERIPAAAGSWNFSFSRWGGGGGSPEDSFKVSAVFLGR